MPDDFPRLADAPVATTAITTPSPVPNAAKLHQVLQWVLCGASEHEISQAIEKNWPSSKPRPLIVAAMKRLAAAGNPDLASVRGFVVEGVRLIYQRCLESGDHPTALRCLKELKDIATSARAAADDEQLLASIAPRAATTPRTRKRPSNRHSASCRENNPHRNNAGASEGIDPTHYTPEVKATR